MSLLMVPFKVDKDYLKLKGDPEGLILTLTWVSITFHCDGLSGADLGGGCRGCAPPLPPEMTCGVIIELVFCKKRKPCGLLVLKQSKRRVQPLLKKILNPPLSLDVFLVALWFVVAASCLKNVLKGRRKQCPGVKVCFLVMLRSSLSYNKVIKMFFSFG